MLLKALRGYLKVPGMYGCPENAESICKHVTHIYLTTKHPGWSFESTTQLWGEIAETLDFGQQFALPQFEVLHYRQQKWGEKEKVVLLRVLNIFKSIWGEIKGSCQLLTHTRIWVEFILIHPLLLGSPDNFDITMSYLMGFAATNCYSQFKLLYEQECLKAKGNANRGLLDLGTQAEWLWEPVKHSKLLPSYNRVSRGIAIVIQRLEQME